jgi:hypothetical protein
MTLAVVMAGLVLAACGSQSTSPHVADASRSPSSASTQPASSTSMQSGSPDPVAYAQCMRSHGVPAFPDPDSSGRFAIKEGDGIDINSAEYKAANDECKSLLPVPSADQQSQDHDALLQYARCMRDHGIADFPDPSASGGLQIEGGAGDLNPSNPQFQAAQNACQQLQPGNGQTNTTLSGG